MKHTIKHIGQQWPGSYPKPRRPAQRRQYPHSTKAEAWLLAIAVVGMLLVAVGAMYDRI